jgi:succinate dehydrogenase/fumarate reductase flavoprotein subunit
MKNGVIVVGAGLAGMMAAIAASDEGAEVTLVDRGAIGLGTNTAMSNAVFAGVSDSYGVEEYVRETMEIGRFLNNRKKVEIAAEMSREAVALLKSLGVPVGPMGTLYQVKSPDPRVISGVTLVRRVAEAIGSRPGIRVVRDLYITGIVKRDGRAEGIEGIDAGGGNIVCRADAVVLATGGAGAMYLRNDNQKYIMGQGYYLAAAAGLPLLDMEFVQFFPVVVAGEGLPATIVYPPVHETIKLVNSAGEDLAVKYSLGSLTDAVMKKRDELSIELYRETRKGTVLLDCRRVPAEAWNEHPLSLLRLIKHDFATKPLPVSPAVHFLMGGVMTDDACQCGLPGLFACGEVTWGLHGANRRGGNALMECAVFGTLAGRNAAHFNEGSPKGVRMEPIEARTGSTGAPGGLRRSLGDIKGEIRKIAWDNAGVIRSAEGLTKGLEAAREIHRELDGFVPGTRRETCAKGDLTAAVVTLKAILTASLARQESRGSFFREDHPREDDTNWKKNSSLTYDPVEGAFAVTHVAAG